METKKEVFWFQLQGWGWEQLCAKEKQIIKNRFFCETPFECLTIVGINIFLGKYEGVTQDKICQVTGWLKPRSAFFQNVDSHQIAQMGYNIDNHKQIEVKMLKFDAKNISRYKAKIDMLVEIFNMANNYEQ